MKKYLFYVFFLVVNVMLFDSCEDRYKLDDYREGKEAPDYLNGTIYGYLKDEGHFNYFVRIIDMVEEDGLKYSEVLARTGSKTLFVADDDAFEAFFADNPYGIRRFEDFSVAQCRSILFCGMLDNAYLVDMMTNLPSSGTPVPGQVMRRPASLPALDSIPFDKGDGLPQNAYWDRFRERGAYVLKDGTEYTMVHFLSPQMRAAGITNEDFRIMTNVTRNENDAFIYDIRIVKKNIVCMNGYINVLERLMLPRENMAEYICKNSETSIFNRLMERFCVPDFDPAVQTSYKKLHPEFTDTIFYKYFFNEDKSSMSMKAPEAYKSQYVAKASLKINPGWNAYSPNDNVMTDMAAIFVPTNEAMEKFFNSGAGSFLKERYGTWDSIPDNLVSQLINNHIRESFLASIPSLFEKIEDNMGVLLDIKTTDVKYSYVCNNGIVYVVNTVYSPINYSSVMAPVNTNTNTQIFNWAIDKLQFNLYLLSMEKGIHYSFLVPGDDVFDSFIDPISIAKGTPEILKFRFDEAKQNVYAVRYDATTGDSILAAPIYGEPNSASTTYKTNRVNNYLTEIMDNHIVVDDIESGKLFYQTKGGATIKVDGSGMGMTVRGGANIERGEELAPTAIYTMRNGNTYFINGIAQPSLNSAFKTLGDSLNYPEFSLFYELCYGATTYSYRLDSGKDTTVAGSIFVKDSYTGIDFNIQFFNTYNYTIYVPTNEAIEREISSGRLKTWDQIDDIEDLKERAEAADRLYHFLRYHFQDNSVYISGVNVSGEYETAAKTADRKKFRKLTLSGDGSNLTVTTESGKKAHVVTADPTSYNVMVRDYKFNTSAASSATTILTSSFAVIHLIDDVLYYE